MSKDRKLLTAAVASVITCGLTTVSLPAHAAKMEKCYGIVKKGKNACGTKLHACAGLAKMDSDPAEWIFLPKGSCAKIVGASLKPGDVKSEHKEKPKES